MLAGDVKEDADGQEGDNQARAAVRDERKGNTGQRSQSEHGCEIDHGLPRHERDEPSRQPLPEGIGARERDPETGIGKGGIGGDHGGHSQKAELLADDREDHVRVRLREVVDLRHSVTQADAEDAAGSHSDQRLHGLEACALRILPRVEEAEDARAPIRLEPDRDQA
jgi:hypothetical protein